MWGRRSPGMQTALKFRIGGILSERNLAGTIPIGVLRANDFGHDMGEGRRSPGRAYCKLQRRLRPLRPYLQFFFTQPGRRWVGKTLTAPLVRAEIRVSKTHVHPRVPASMLESTTSTS